MISDSIAPRLAPELDITPWRRTHLLAVQVYPRPGRPHHLKREGPEAGVYVRVGSTNRRADRELIEELRRFARGEAFDEQAMPELDSEALDFRAASESFAPVRKLKRADLETLRLVTTHQGRKVPAVGGMLLFGRERLRHFPDAWIQAGRFDGKDKTRIADQIEIRSYPVQAIEAAIAFIQKHSLHGAHIGRGRTTSSFSANPNASRSVSSTWPSRFVTRCVMNRARGSETHCVPNRRLGRCSYRGPTIACCSASKTPPRASGT